MAVVHSVRNPWTGKADAQVSFADPSEVTQQILELRQNAFDWASLNSQKRAKALATFADALSQNAPKIQAALLRDTGRYRESLIEIQGSIGLVRAWAAQTPALLNETSRASATPPVIIRSQNVPFPVVGVVSPWNFPLLLSLIDSVVALAAGCTVLIKPSEVTPRFIEPLRAAIAEAGLQHVMKVLAGDGQVGAALCNEADMLCFTGSVETGRKVSAVAGQRMIPASLELGGKDAALVFADADLDHAAKAICWGGFTNAGQACQAIERVYVEESVFEDFTRRLVDCTKGLTLNNQDIQTGEIGPIIAERQIDIIQSQLEDAQNKGAKKLVGGELVESGGIWCSPGILVDVDHSMDLMCRESFAALLPVMPFKDEAKALSLANDSIFGLSGAVFSQNVQKALRVAEQMEAGAISINDCALTTQVFDAEKNAFKASGLGGSRMGQASVRRFIRHRALLENPTTKPDNWWFPSLGE